MAVLFTGPQCHWNSSDTISEYTVPELMRKLYTAAIVTYPDTVYGFDVGYARFSPEKVMAVAILPRPGIEIAWEWCPSEMAWLLNDVRSVVQEDCFGAQWLDPWISDFEMAVTEPTRTQQTNLDNGELEHEYREVLYWERYFKQITGSPGTVPCSLPRKEPEAEIDDEVQIYCNSTEDEEEVTTSVPPWRAIAEIFLSVADAVPNDTHVRRQELVNLFLE
ncbi:uncharacterized protein V1518DRAFT_417317 [Limtongia smithiae]|uniref:uncharacterized protein n=1 Tax=Limtongia smithiae TaxID=1125753 RepID=UPI0034CEF2F1